MKNTFVLTVFILLFCTYCNAYSKLKHYEDYIVKIDTVYIDLRNDPDFKFDTNLRWFQDANIALFGIKKDNGELFIEPLFYQIESFVDGVSIVTYENNQGAINTKGEVVIPYIYSELQTSSEDMIAFQKDGLWGFFNKQGIEVIAPEYEFADSFSDGLALVSKDQLFGYINKKGKVVIPFQFDYASRFENEEAQVQIKFKSFTINTQGMKVAN